MGRRLTSRGPTSALTWVALLLGVPLFFMFACCGGMGLLTDGGSPATTSQTRQQQRVASSDNALTTTPIRSNERERVATSPPAKPVDRASVAINDPPVDEPPVLEFRNWTSANGNHTIVAALVAIESHAVQLRKEDGTQVTVPFAKLSSDDVFMVTGKPPPNVIEGKVVGIADGDTLTVLDADHNYHKIRLIGIDAPEHGQDYGGVLP